MLKLQAAFGSVPFGVVIRTPEWKVLSLAEVWQDSWIKLPDFCDPESWTDRLLFVGEVLLFPSGELQLTSQRSVFFSWDVTAHGVMYAARLRSKSRTVATVDRFQFLTKDSPAFLRRDGRKDSYFNAQGSLSFSGEVGNTACVRVVSSDAIVLDKPFALVGFPKNPISLKRVQ